jgi:hypothetical protein
MIAKSEFRYHITDKKLCEPILCAFPFDKKWFL